MIEMVRYSKEDLNLYNPNSFNIFAVVEILIVAAFQMRAGK